ncbi:MAG TPA: HD domain-containing phosphohydrolase [Candidatus Acidoferrales bacterium]|nr:HD domain-containing phosphohydrolase [Candidatus Acidoferrales bacterium]
MRPLDLNSLLPRRVRILWLVLGALLLVSILPIALYHHQVLRLSQDKLEDTERVQQIELTRSMAEQLQLFQSTLRQQLISERQILALTSLSDNVNDPANVPRVTRLLQTFVESTPNVLYVMAVGTDAKGGDAGDFGVKRDPFVGKALQRAFMTTEQLLESHSDPLALDPDNRPGLVVAVPLEVGGRFSGMLAAVVSLDSILSRLKEASAHDRSVFIVDHAGHIVAHPDSKVYFPGTDFSSLSPLVAKIRDLPPDFRDTETVRFNLKQGNRSVPMMGAYSTMPELNWAVISQRSLEKAREDAGVNELNNQALSFVIVVSIAALILGYLFAVAISTPIRRLAQSTQAISRGEFHERTPVRGAAEIRELAETFNKMAGDIEQYIERLKQAARENRELFLGSIRMLAAAIDEKDPYTRGHSDRVAKYSLIIGRELNLTDEELDRLRISALLHDVGKIGVDDRVLKKPGALTDEEFELMKQHPAKGANIMRPVAQLAEMLPGIELHHEHVDGRGYPYGLRGDQIPLMARIIAVADTLDAVTTHRPYQSAMDLDFALSRIRTLTGSKFDPVIVDALEAAVQSGKIKLKAELVTA